LRLCLLFTLMAGRLIDRSQNARVGALRRVVAGAARRGLTQVNPSPVAGSSVRIKPLPENTHGHS